MAVKLFIYPDHVKESRRSFAQAEITFIQVESLRTFVFESGQQIGFVGTDGYWEYHDNFLNYIGAQVQWL